MTHIDYADKLSIGELYKIIPLISSTRHETIQIPMVKICHDKRKSVEFVRELHGRTRRILFYEIPKNKEEIGLYLGLYRLVDTDLYDNKLLVFFAGERILIGLPRMGTFFTIESLTV